MAGLFTSLTTASQSLAAANTGMDVAGQNIANVNTPGYTRRRVLLAEVPPASDLSATGGVTVQGIRAERDPFIEARLANEQEAGAYDQATVSGLSDIEAAIGLPGQSLDAQLSDFFSAFSTLADDPTSASARDGVVVQAQRLTAGFHDLSDRLGSARRTADASIVDDIGHVNQLAAQVAHLNDQISLQGPDVETLRDERNTAVAELVRVAGAAVTTRPDGQVDLSVGNGRALVVGATAYTLEGTATAPNGLAAIKAGDVDITSEITGGEIGGLLHVRDAIVPGYQSQIDQLAFDVAAAVNTAHQAGFDANGDAGGDFFTPPATVAGAASALSVADAVAGDPQLIAASGTGAAGDNAAARTIAALRDAPIAAGGTASAVAAWSQFAYRVGTDVSSAKASSDSHDAVTRQLQQLRDQTSGVSLDEEAANLMRFQRAYEANARYFTTIADTLNTLMNMVQ
jgi:flagellar hook-associated protein 1 FlgK